jgi:hypothetical protein
MHRGEIWLVNLNPTVGTEISKTRPCIIVNDDAIGVLPLKVIVPVTDWKDSFAVRPWMVKLEPSTENSLIVPRPRSIQAKVLIVFDVKLYRRLRSRFTEIFRSGLSNFLDRVVLIRELKRKKINLEPNE